MRARRFLPGSATPFSVSALLVLLSAQTARAQYGGGPGMMPGMPQGPTGPDDQTQDGPAEAAPDEDQPADEDEPIGLYRPEHHRTQVVELDGYLRLRTDWFRHLDLGQGWGDPGGAGGGMLTVPPPFPRPIECGQTVGDCRSKTLGSANTRLRLEPVIHVTDQVRVLSQIDILDNTIMGSTPDSLAAASMFGGRNVLAPHPVLSNTQDPPELGRNSVRSSIRAKRVWGEIDSEFGQLLFGRMPWHWGRGMLFNEGSCLDCDGQTNVDRIMALTFLYGHRVALAWDFGSSGTTLDGTPLGTLDPEGFPLDLSQSDDVFQLTGSILRREDDDRFRARAMRGDLAVNYGFQLVYRTQDRALYPPNAVDGQAGSGETTMLAEAVDAMVFIPDLWFKLGWRALTIEFESAAVLGKVDNAGPLVAPGGSTELSLAQAGWVLNMDLALFKNTFFVGFETGGATGDKSENPNAYLNYRWREVQQRPGDNSSHAFFFSPQYHVDQILFRRLLGTVSNAIYFKPKIAYWLGLTEARQLGLQAQFVYAMAPINESTPGDSLSYGMELDLGATYRNPQSGFLAGFTWGLFWPFGALERPSTMEGADVAQVIRTFLGITF